MHMHMWMQNRYRCRSAVVLLDSYWRGGWMPTRHPQVVDAYLKPAVDHDEQPCKWERPDLHGLREFCSVHFNWPQAKADEQLLPVMQVLEEVTTSYVTTYYTHCSPRNTYSSTNRY